MKTRWTIAVLGVIALAVVTISTEMPWVFKPEVATMIEAPAPVAAVPAHDPHAADGPALACPADAKPANLAFTMKDHTGLDVTLASFKGKVLLIDFWATWCGPCKVEIPYFVAFQEQYGKDGLQILGVSVDDTQDKLLPYIKSLKMNYPVLQGLGHDDVQEAFGPMVGIPTSVMVSRDGKICATHTGLTGRDVFEREIKALL